MYGKKSLSQLGSSMTAFALYLTNNLVVWHLYAVNAFSGLMNTVQQPASEVATTLLIPKEQYQRASGLQSLSRSLISILNPLFATALYGLAGLEIVIFFDLGSFVVAFLALLFLIKIPAVAEDKKESVLMLAKGGIAYLKNTPMILTMIMFMSGINLVVSAFDAVLPGLIIPNPKGGTVILGVVTSFSGIAMIFGSILVSVLPKPENRIKVVYITMLISMGIENYMMSFFEVLYRLNSKVGYMHAEIHCSFLLFQLVFSLEDLWWMISLSLLWKCTKVTRVYPFCLDMGKAQAQPLPCLL